MPSNPDLFTRTFEIMQPSENLLIMGGTFPGENEQAEVRVGRRIIIPIMHIVTGRNEYAPRDNPVFQEGEEEPLTVTLERNDRRFGHDAHDDGSEISYGKAAGKILDLTVDLVILNPLSPNTFYFVGKPSDE